MFKRLYLPSEIRQSLNIYKKTKSLRKTASITGISKSSIQRWNVLGLSSIRKKQIKRKKNKTKKQPFDDMILEIISKNKLTTLLNIQKEVIEKVKKNLSLSTLYRSLQRSKISWKKASIKCCYCSPKVLQEKTQIFFSKIQNIPFDQIACIDETGFLNVDSKAYGYSRKGERLQIRKHITKRLKKSCCMAITQNGIQTYNLQEGNFGKSSFILFITEFVKNNKNIKYVVMDNIAFHHSKEVLDILHAQGMSAIYIPPYSPDCNPIENVFSIIKGYFRRLFNRGICFEDSITTSICETQKAYKDMTNIYTKAFCLKIK